MATKEDPPPHTQTCHPPVPPSTNPICPRPPQPPDEVIKYLYHLSLLWWETTRDRLTHLVRSLCLLLRRPHPSVKASPRQIPIARQRAVPYSPHLHPLLSPMQMFRRLLDSPRLLRRILTHLLLPQLMSRPTLPIFRYLLLHLLRSQHQPPWTRRPRRRLSTRGKNNPPLLPPSRRLHPLSHLPLLLTVTFHPVAPLLHLVRLTINLSFISQRTTNRPSRVWQLRLRNLWRRQI